MSTAGACAAPSSPAVTTPGWLGDKALFRLGIGEEDCSNALLSMLSMESPWRGLSSPGKASFCCQGAVWGHRAVSAGRLCLNDAVLSRCPRDSQEVGPRQGTGNESPTAEAKQGLSIETNCLR